VKFIDPDLVAEFLKRRQQFVLQGCSMIGPTKEAGSISSLTGFAAI